MRFIVSEPFPDCERLNTEFDYFVLSLGVLLQRTGFALADKEVWKTCNSTFSFLPDVKSRGIDLSGFVWEQLLVILMDESYRLSTTTVCLICSAAVFVSHSI
jgi:hypothetical protein